MLENKAVSVEGMRGPIDAEHVIRESIRLYRELILPKLRAAPEAPRRRRRARTRRTVVAHPSFGLILANRAVVLGKVSVRDLIDLTAEGERSGAFDTVWVGDSLLAKPRLEAVTLLSTLAGVTTRMRLGVGCMATFVHRHPVLLAHQWASLDVLSGGRSWLAVCLGGPNEASAAQALEHSAMSIRASERVGRLEEGIAILRKLFHEDKVTHEGAFYRFEGVTIQPHPVQSRAPSGSRAIPPGSPGRAGRARRTRWWSGAIAASPASPTGG